MPVASTSQAELVDDEEVEVIEEDELPGPSLEVHEAKRAPSNIILPPTKKTKPDNSDLLLQTAMQILNQPVEADDIDDLFGKSVAAEIRLIKDFRTKQMAKIQIQKIIIDAQLSGSNVVVHEP